MKVRKKANAGSMRRRKGYDWVRPPVQQQADKQGPGGSVGENKSNRRGPNPRCYPDGLKTEPDGLERIRKAWEYKQEELEVRWATAQARQAEKNARRNRAIKIGSSVASVVLALLLCIVAWVAA